MSKPAPTNHLTRADHQRLACEIAAGALRDAVAMFETSQEYDRAFQYAPEDAEGILHWLRDIQATVERRARRIGTL